MDGIGLSLDRMREKSPLVQCITNYVAMNIAANVLLAAGASPAMAHAEEEAGEFAALAGALTINLGTISPHWLGGMRAAIDGARGAGRPWVLDPVACFATGLRREVAAEMVALAPDIIRGNASEILALSGGTGGGKGVDSGDPVSAAEEGARALARRTGGVVAVTGKVDFVTDGTRAARVHGGSAWMPRCTALGCSLTGLVGAFAAVAPDRPLDATVAALAMFGVAGAQAHEGAGGPGSFQVAFLDRLAGCDGAMLRDQARLDWL
ncbi:MAG: hydroxyethylthiazole kinase [Paracoccus sp. (in: a-proteobacteria)]|nr:hydroxyethylthiazole kinase [Paracoccus sp. (in: a-proteobacteria)]